MDVLCTDKTGTLTEGKIVLKDYFSVDEEKEPRIMPYSLLCNNAVVEEKIVGNPMDIAVWDYARENGAQASVKAYAKVDEIPFDYQRRMMSVVVKKDEEFILISKGAPESIFAKCKYAETEGRKEPLSAVLESINEVLRPFATGLSHPCSGLQRCESRKILYCRGREGSNASRLSNFH
jgi:Mg2+-importing ATPase